MKKYFIRTLFLILFFTLLSGCNKTSKKNPEETPYSNIPVNDDAIAEAYLPPEEITAVIKVDIGDNRKILKESINLFNKKFPNITVEFEELNMNREFTLEYVTKHAAANDLPDIVFNYPGNVGSLIEQGFVYPLNSFLDADPDYQYLPSKLMECGIFNGTIYSIPSRCNMIYVGINLDVMNALGLDMPRIDWSFDEFKQFLISGTTTEYSGTETFWFGLDDAQDLSHQSDWGASAIGPVMYPTGHLFGFDPATFSFNLTDTYVKGVEFLDSLSLLPGVVTSLSLRDHDDAAYIEKFGEGDTGNGWMAWKMGKVLCQSNTTYINMNWLNIDFAFYAHAFPQEPSVGMRPVSLFWNSFMFADTENPRATFEVMKWLCYDPVGVGAILDYHTTPYFNGSTLMSAYYFSPSRHPDIVEKTALHPNMTDDLLYMYDHVNNAVWLNIQGIYPAEWNIMKEYGFENATNAQAAGEIEKRANDALSVYKEDWLARLSVVQEEFDASRPASYGAQKAKAASPGALSNADTQSDGTLAGTLTISSLTSAQFMLQPAADAFRRKNPGVSIVIHEYDITSPGEFAKYLQITEDIQAGIADDLIESTLLDTCSLADQELLVEFHALMNSDEDFSTDEYFENVFDRMTYSGGLYAFPTNNFYKLVTINRNAPEYIVSQFEALDQISYEEMYRLYLQMLPVQNDLYFEADFDPQAALENEYGRFINAPKRSCDFENDSFINLLQVYKDIDDLGKAEQNSSQGSTSYFLPDTEESLQYLFKVVELSNMSDLKYFLPYEENNFIHPIPLVSGAGGVIGRSRNDYVIPVSSEKQTLAWEFLKFLTEGEWLLNNTSVTRFNNNAVNRALYRAANENMLNEFIDTSILKGIELPENVSRSECVRDALDTFDAYRERRMENYTAEYLAGDIIYEEFEIFLNNRSTAEQTARSIQNKLSVALKE